MLKNESLKKMVTYYEMEDIYDNQKTESCFKQILAIFVMGVCCEDFYIR